ncbi:unnamed protein product [Heterosigma akashiwo]
MVSLDGTPLPTLKPSWLRRQIGVVDQEPTLFAGSIAENIAFGNPDATAKDIVAAAKLANADEFIQEFPDKYDTQVGENGKFLSGGQKQRLALARAVVSNPAILILDEATSSLDAASEALVTAALAKAAAGRTTLVIAHRKSTIQSAKNLAFLNDGKIECCGTYDELLERSEDFAKLMNELSNKPAC